jgi:hypothetical protein
MGFYINPRTETKEEWLAQNGLRVDEAGYKVPDDCRLVCLVDNSGFTAAGIAFNEGERQAFARPDGRRKRWFIVSNEKLNAVCPELHLKVG